MPWRVFQDYAHHIETPPERVLAPWHLYPANAVIPEGIDKGWLPEFKVPLLEAQVQAEYGGDPPPVQPRPIPDPYVPEPVIEPEEKMS